MYGVKEVAEMGAHVLPPRGKICCVLADASRAKVFEGKAMTEDKQRTLTDITKKVLTRFVVPASRIWGKASLEVLLESRT